ncbi:MAG: efflux RND transporter periplasmic adaptor subunit [Dysgonamonadaceae bacterium]|jgi:cobalt-zinc-cadmium efflux system membrane fusion protein|nr:efflux RND transporter periplasmic adaptor subunit [Dysgonamonadaceae bacterium]
MNKRIALAGVFCIFLASCKNNNPTNDTTGIAYNGDTVSISEQSIINSKIKLQTVELKNFSAEFNTTGTVKAISGQIAEIAPLFGGRITQSYARPGQKVNAGTPLFEMYSAEFSEIVKDYFQSLQTKKMKELNFQRQKDLVQNGVGAAKEQEEAETDYEVALKEYENTVANLKMLNINPHEISMGQALKIVSPIAGEVVQTNVVIGQHVKSDAKPLAIIAELSKVWVVAQVKEKNIASIHQDDKVEIRTDADPEQIITGTISHISELLDEETRSVQVLIVCDNKERKLKPGMFANVHFINSPEESIVIPSTALLQNEDKSYVFVQESKGRFIRYPVEIVTANGREVLITRGLKTGDVIVSEGGIYLMEN